MVFGGKLLGAWQEASVLWYFGDNGTLGMAAQGLQDAEGSLWTHTPSRLCGLSDAEAGVGAWELVR